MLRLQQKDVPFDASFTRKPYLFSYCGGRHHLKLKHPVTGADESRAGLCLVTSPLGTP